MTDNTKNTTQRKVGGPAERLSWLVANAKDVTPGAFRLLVVLADHAKHDGTAYPSWARLKELTGVSHSSIDRQLVELKAAGLVTLTHHGKGSRTVNHYQLSGAIHGWVSSPAGGTTDDVNTSVENGASSPVDGIRVVPPAGQESSRGRDTGSPVDGIGNPVYNPVINPRESCQPNPPGDSRWGVGLVDSQVKVEATAEVERAKSARAAAKAEVERALLEETPPCYRCERERWTDDRDKQLHFLRTGGTPDNAICSDCLNSTTMVNSSVGG